MRTIRRLSLWASLLALVSIAVPTSALGAANHPFLSAITNTPTGFEDACGVAFNPGGSLYVSDYYHDTIVGSPGIANEDPGDGPCKIAFDSAGNLYVNNWHRNVVKYSEPFGVGEVIDPELPTTEQPTGLAVDPATNDVYVAHRTYVAEYGPTGSPIATIGTGHLEDAYGIAVSDFPATKGFLYLPDASNDTVKVFNPAVSLTTPVEVMTGAATPQGAFTYLVDSEVAVDNSPSSPSYGHLFVLDAIGQGLSEHPAAVLDEFNAAGAYRGQITGFTDAEPSGIAFQEGTHNVYLTSGNSEASAVFVYGPTAPAHSLTVVKSGPGGGTVTSQPNGIVCGEACTAEYNEGQLVTLFANPDAHSAFSGWSVSGAEPCPGTGSCSVLLSKNVEVTGNFAEPVQETLQVSVSGSGSVTSSPAGLTCSSGTCSEHFNEGRLVTLTANAPAGSYLAHWSGCDSEPSPSECKLTMSAAKAVEADFAANPQAAASGVGPAVAAIGPSSPPPPAVLTLSAKGAVLTASVPGAGTLSATGKGLKQAQARPAGAGTVTLPLTLSARGRRALRKAKTHRLAVKVRVAFTSSDGTAVLASKAVIFRTTQPPESKHAQR